MPAPLTFRGRGTALEYQRLAFLAGFYAWSARKPNMTGPWRNPLTGQSAFPAMEGRELARATYAAAARLYLAKARAFRLAYSA